MTYRLSEALTLAVSALNTVSESPKLDAEVLLANVIEKNRTYLYTWPEKTLSETQEILFFAAIEKRKKGVPIAHITGYREFWSLKLKTNDSTLIPRPDTELLVELALDKAMALPAENKNTLLDLGTGTGAIALALASELPNWQVIAADYSQSAVQLALENKQQLNLNNATILQSDWFSNIEQTQFDLIVSNPPYIDPVDPHLNQGDVRFEPLSALVAEQNGMADIEHIITTARDFLNDSAWLIIEHGYDQGKLVRDFFEKMAYKNIKTEKDLGGNDRISLAQWHKTDYIT